MSFTPVILLGRDASGAPSGSSIITTTGPSRSTPRRSNQLGFALILGPEILLYEAWHSDFGGQSLRQERFSRLGGPSSHVMGMLRFFEAFLTADVLLDLVC